MIDRAAFRIALIAIAGALCLVAGLVWPLLAQGDVAGAFLALPDALYGATIGLTFDQTFFKLTDFGTPWTVPHILIGLGRFLLPAAVIYALYQLIDSHIASIWAHWRARHARDHTIVTGAAAGDAFATSLGPDVRTVRLADDAGTPRQSAVHGKRITLARAGEIEPIWRDIGLLDARQIILAGDQAQNLADMATITRLFGESARFQDRASADRPVTVYAAIDNQTVLEALIESETALKPLPGCELRPYSPFQLAARQTFAAQNFHAEARRLGRTRLNALFVGYGPFNAAMHAHFLAMAPAAGFGRPRTTILARDAAAIAGRLSGETPALADFADVFVLPWPEAKGGLHRDALPGLDPADMPMTVVFVDLGTSDENAVRAVRLRQLANEAGVWQAPILAYCPETTNIIGPTGLARKPPQERVAAVGRFQDTCRVDLLDGSQEKAARRIHEHYRVRELAEGGSSTDQRLQPWERLNETWRNASRRAGDHAPVKLESARHLLAEAGLSEPDNPISALDANGLLALAKAEHESWAIERALQGWRCGARDDKRKCRPSLVPFEELPEDEKRKDFDQLRLLTSL